MIDETLPHSKDCEKALLSQLVLCQDIKKWTESSIDICTFFYLPEHQILFKEIVKDEHRDLETILYRVGDKLEEIGGRDYLADLYIGEANESKADNYFHILCELKDRRNAITASRQIERLALDNTSTLDEIIELSKSIQSTNLEKGTIDGAEELTIDFENWVNQINSGEISEEGIGWGFGGLPDVIDMLRPPDLCLVGGDYGSGKTSLANSMVALSCVPNKKPALIFSLEMSKRQEVLRLASIVGRIPLKKIMTKGAMNIDDLGRFQLAIKELYNANFGICDEILSIEEIAEKSKEFKEKNGLSLVVIDNCQLVRLRSGKGINSWSELGNVALKSKWMAKDLNCVVVLLTQISKDEGNHPYGADIARGHCDQFIVIQQSEPEDVVKRVYIDKNRNGVAKTEVECPWYGPAAAFYTQKD